MNCLNANGWFLLALASAGLLALGFRWGWSRAVTKYEHVKRQLASQPVRYNRRTGC